MNRFRVIAEELGFTLCGSSNGQFSSEKGIICQTYSEKELFERRPKCRVGSIYIHFPYPEIVPETIVTQKIFMYTGKPGPEFVFKFRDLRLKDQELDMGKFDVYRLFHRSSTRYFAHRLLLDHDVAIERAETRLKQYFQR